MIKEKRFSKALLVLALITLFGLLSIFAYQASNDAQPSTGFSGQQAYQYASAFSSFGPRVPGTLAHEEARQLITAELKRLGWIVNVQQFHFEGQDYFNLIGSASQPAENMILIGVHYDSRRFADRDPNPENRNHPVPGANDGASGVGVLLELAAKLPLNTRDRVQLVFFDGEDQGRINDLPWIIGSTFYVNNTQFLPEQVIILDMVGDKDQRFYFESNSNLKLQTEVWDMAAELGYQEYFIPKSALTILDDHIPFVNAGIPAIDIIDFDYPYWHTIEDTMDKLDPVSLERIGIVIYNYLTNLDQKQE